MWPATNVSMATVSWLTILCFVLNINIILLNRNKKKRHCIGRCFLSSEIYLETILFVDKELKIRFLLLKRNNAQENPVKSQLIRQIPRSRKYCICIIACHVNIFAKFLLPDVNNGVYKGIYVTTCLRVVCGKGIFEERDFRRGSEQVCGKGIFQRIASISNILIQILNFPYFPFTNRKRKKSFHTGTLTLICENAQWLYSFSKPSSLHYTTPYTTIRVRIRVMIMVSFLSILSIFP